ncbi:CTLH/CRA C-terminal to lish motif domain-containing protein [Roridomyces roridus]|uniref:CTLH/CRA C-terminal to lish motif domain-containing protein n=1 Tax=Roridomyces roridus TaxID=1738132 RepID=A0AAD7BWY0_9AGAR|nr:CTLH/CRA C-terminal to lish motif domain-containing protein [Roridomyces roridus]
MSRDPSPEHIRTLVIDYLVHHGYKSTARAFAQGSMAPTSLDADGDEIMQPAGTAELPGTSHISEETFAQIDLRQEIRTHIMQGRIADAVEALEKHYPAVLSSETLPSAPRPHKSLTGTDFVAPTTINPAHLTLNLRILAFIETIKAIPGSAAPDEEDSKTLDLLAKAKKLHVLVSMLPDSAERAAYTQELRNVAGLLAYPNPESSPVASYLSQDRREAVAAQIDTAILYRMGQPAVSQLEISTRYTSVLWSFLHDLDVKQRPGVPLPPTSAEKPASPTSRGKDKDGSEAVPRFELQSFINFKA